MPNTQQDIIRVTQGSPCNRTKVFIRASSVIAIHQHTSQKTNARITFIGGHSIQVNETPEQVVELITRRQRFS